MIKIKDSKGEIFTMPSSTPKCILEVHYCKSYFQFVVQDHYTDENGDVKYPTKDIFIPLDGSNWVDLIAIKDGEIGTLVTLQVD